MTIAFEERTSNSPFIESVTHGWTLSAGTTTRPAEVHWHMVLRKLGSASRCLIVGPLRTAGQASWGEGAELIWIKFKLGTFMPRMPTRYRLDVEQELPDATSRSFWLDDTAWEYPDYDNVEAFVERLARGGTISRDPIVHDTLQDDSSAAPARTVRHRFLTSTGLTQAHIRQFERARRAESLLEQGVSILDTVFEAGYFDQPHLTRSLKKFIGKTPAEITETPNSLVGAQ